jgi:DNA polymerase III delta subunit
MINNKNASIGQIIRRIRSGKISPIYTLFGGDSFLEDYFLSELTANYLQNSNKGIYYSLDQDSEQKLFEELSAISMFEDKRVIIVREIKKLRTKQGREDLIQYIQSPNPFITLVIICHEYDFHNSFLKNITKQSEFIDVRTPFNEKMEEWVRYILKKRKIKITNEALRQYIHVYGDSTAHVINEIEKISLMLGNEEINEDNFDQIQGHDRVFHLWQLQDSLGKKNLHKSMDICFSLIENQTPIPKILVNLVYLYQQILFRKMGQSKPIGFTGINKIITSNISHYDQGYSYDEIIQLLLELRKVDLLSKSTSLSNGSLLHPLIVKICNNIYA